MDHVFLFEWVYNILFFACFFYAFFLFYFLCGVTNSPYLRIFQIECPYNLLQPRKHIKSASTSWCVCDKSICMSIYLFIYLSSPLFCGRFLTLVIFINKFDNNSVSWEHTNNLVLCFFEARGRVKSSGSVERVGTEFVILSSITWLFYLLSKLRFLITRWRLLSVQCYVSASVPLQS